MSIMKKSGMRFILFACACLIFTGCAGKDEKTGRITDACNKLKEENYTYTWENTISSAQDTYTASAQGTYQFKEDSLYWQIIQTTDGAYTYETTYENGTLSQRVLLEGTELAPAKVTEISGGPQELFLLSFLYDREWDEKDLEEIKEEKQEGGTYYTLTFSSAYFEGNREAVLNSLSAPEGSSPETDALIKQRIADTKFLSLQETYVLDSLGRLLTYSSVLETEEPGLIQDETGQPVLGEPAKITNEQKVIFSY